jgi:hypothetical protein
LPESRQLVRLAVACFLLSYIESVSAAGTFALKHRYDVDPRQELLGLGAASLLVGLFQGYPVAAEFPDDVKRVRLDWIAELGGQNAHEEHARSPETDSLNLDASPSAMPAAHTRAIRPSA